MPSTEMAGIEVGSDTNKKFKEAEFTKRGKDIGCHPNNPIHTLNTPHNNDLPKITVDDVTQINLNSIQFYFLCIHKESGLV